MSKAAEIREHVVELDQLGEREGYIINADHLKSGLKTRDDIEVTSLKTASDGHTVLVPQPTDDPNDPLNWSSLRKHTLLLVISYTAFLPDYGSAIGAIALVPQSEQWDMSPDDVLRAQAGSVAMLGVGGLFVVAFSVYFGRLPVLFWFTLLAFLTAAWSAAVDSFYWFFVARMFNAFFSTVAQAGGLMFIKDIFFFHEYARMINVWGFAIILAPYLGPCLAAFMLSTQGWGLPFWVYTIEVGLAVIAIVTCMDETYYNRQIPINLQPPRKSRFMRLIGIEQFRSRHLRSTFGRAMLRPIQALFKVPVFLSTVYYVATFSWAVGTNSALAVFLIPLYGLDLKQIGFFYFTPIVAALLGNFAGYWLHDLIVKLYSKRHLGRFEPEARLWAGWISTPFLISGLVLLGFCLQRHYHYMLTSFAWGLYVFGTMIATVGVDAYVLDSYPEGPGEVIMWLTAARTVGGFLITLFQVRWAEQSGAEVSFAIQGGSCAGAFLILLFLQMFGKRLRHWQGPLPFQTK
ncbi:MAG: hypothetical protein Q9216_001307 [Gyalolechia sp. 2 TL-2023]